MHMSPPPHLSPKTNVADPTTPQPAPSSNESTLALPLVMLSSHLGSTSTAAAIVILAGVSAY